MLRLKKKIWLLCLGGMLVTFQYAITVYVNTPALSKYFSLGTISLAYIVASVLGIVLLMYMPYMFSRVGLVRTFLYGVMFAMLGLFAIASDSGPMLILASFVIFLSVQGTLNVCLDEFFEKHTDDGETSKNRGAMLTFHNIAWVLAPLCFGLLIGIDLLNIYLIATITLIPLLVIIAHFFKYENIRPKKYSVNPRSFFFAFIHQDKNVVRISLCYLMLQFFFSWMVLYLSILLTQNVGFSWGDTGRLYTIMLLPFLLTELPISIFEDKRTSERKFLFFGFLIMGLTAILVGINTIHSFIMWACILFVSRIGASFVEVTAERYFFKLVNAADAESINQFRIMRPLSFILASLISLPVVWLVGTQTSFVALGILTCLGIFLIPECAKTAESVTEHKRSVAVPHRTHNI